MEWFYLAIAGLLEIGWPVGMKFGWNDKGLHVGWLITSMICMGLSSIFLLLAQRTLPIGTAYAIWTGVGVVGAFFCGLYFFHESGSLLRWASIGFIIIGIIGLKLAS
jgi:quaternary ammonium compound-resistance protein SugE